MSFSVFIQCAGGVVQRRDFSAPGKLLGISLSPAPLLWPHQRELVAPKTLYADGEHMHHDAIAGRARSGKLMNRSTQLRFAAAVLFGLAAVSLTGLPARAFS